MSLSKNQAAVEYTLSPADPKGHYFTVSILIPSSSAEGHILSLPNWIPGSYLIRDFSKHIINLQAQTLQNTPLNLQPIEKSTWQIEPCLEPLKVTYQVYAWDLSVRGAHFDETHAFFNETSVFLAVKAFKDQPCKVSLIHSNFSQNQNWQIGTTLPILKTQADGFGDYWAKNYRELIEYPVEMGNFMSLEFKACGIPHQIILTGQFQRQKLDTKQLIQDLTRICEYELSLFGKPYPIKQFLFQVMVTEDGYGGLEHLNSTALMCARNHLPYTFNPERTDGYLQFLELCSHEYFHTWNVKRIQPEVYQTTNLADPVYTNQLWWFEGITSFYDGLFLKRAGILNEVEYLNRLAKEMTRVYRMPGRFKQSVAESSFLTWTKFYQQDENAPNAIISYYTKGSLIALGLDLTIRTATDNQKSLDDILLTLWQNYGQTRQGLKEGEIETICSEVSGIPLKHFFDQYLYGTEDIPFETLFAEFGIQMTLRPAIGQADTGGIANPNDFMKVTLGANLAETEHKTLKVSQVWEASTAYKAGIAAGDEIIALNHYKMTSLQTIESFLNSCQIDEKITCHFFRRDELKQSTLVCQAIPNDRVQLILSTSSSETLNWFTQK